MDTLDIGKEKRTVPVLRFGEFDEKWSKNTLGEITSYVDYRGRAPEKSTKGAFLVTAKNIRKGFIDYETSKEYVPLENYEKVMSKGLPQIGDILFTTEAPLGNVCQVDDDRIALAQRVIKLRGDKNLNNDYLLHYMLSYYYQKLINRMGFGTTVLGISGKALRKTIIKFPTLPEQKKIATFLSTIDKKIQQLTRKKALVEAYKKGLMQQLFSGVLRFRPARQGDGDEEGKDYPAWEEKRLGEVGEFQGGGTPVSSKKEYWEGSIPWISSSDIKEHSVREIEITRYITEEAIIESATKLIPKNSILIVSRVGIGKFAVATRDLCTSQDFTNLISSENSYFLAYYFKTKANRFISLSQGTSIKGFTGKDIRNLKFLIPSIQEQKKIANYLSSIDTKIETITTQITKTQTFKKGLLQQMFV